MICKKCGQRIPDDAKRCIYCGTKNEPIHSDGEHIKEEDRIKQKVDEIEGLFASVNNNAQAAIIVSFFIPLVALIIIAISHSLTGMIVFISFGLIVCGFIELLFSLGARHSHNKLKSIETLEEPPKGTALYILAMILSLAEIIIPIVRLINR